jgi:ATP-dependent protease ClpP protease subunit
MQAADDRVIHQNASMMIHDGNDGFSGHAKNFEMWAEQSKKTRQLMYDIYAERSGKASKYWEKKCLIDFVMDAQEAVNEGLADKVFGEADEKE